MTINLSSKGSSSMFPSLTPSVYGNAIFDYASSGSYAEGFSGDGDFISIPTYYATYDIVYYNSSKVQQWSIGPSDVNANCGYWVGMTLDDTDGVVYAIAVDIGTTPNTYYTCSINSAGTITNIGNDQPSVVDFINGMWMGGHVVDSSDDTTFVQRASTGSGNLFIRQGSIASTPSGLFEAEINISTGAFVSDPTVVSSLGAFFPASYKTGSGIYIGGFAMDMDRSDIKIYLHDSISGTIYTTIDHIAVQNISTAGLKTFVWKDKTQLGGLSYDITEFDIWVDKLAALAGVS